MQAVAAGRGGYEEATAAGGRRGSEEGPAAAATAGASRSCYPDDRVFRALLPICTEMYITAPATATNTSTIHRPAFMSP